MAKDRYSTLAPCLGLTALLAVGLFLVTIFGGGGGGDPSSLLPKVPPAISPGELRTLQRRVEDLGRKLDVASEKVRAANDNNERDALQHEGLDRDLKAQIADIEAQLVIWKEAYARSGGSPPRSAKRVRPVAPAGVAGRVLDPPNRPPPPPPPPPAPSSDEGMRESALRGDIAVVVIACNRPAVRMCLDRLIKFRPRTGFQIVVSQDCGHAETARVIKGYADQGVFHMEQPDLGEVVGMPSSHRNWAGYYKIARHYKFALGRLFESHGFGATIIVEDDLKIAPDFYSYMSSTKRLLDADSSLMAVSAWNDNGKAELVKDKFGIYRSDFFPGLGWMLTSAMWKELGPK